jgi:hypothetical protein
VDGAERAGGVGGPRALVAAALVREADRERARRLGGALADGRHDGRRIDAAAQEGAVAHVGHQLPLHRGHDLGAQLLGQLVDRRACELLSRRSAVAVRPGRAALEHEHPRRRQLRDAFEDRARRRHEAPGQHVLERHAVDPRSRHARREQRPDLRGGGEAAAVRPPVQRLDSEGIAGQHETVVGGIPEREGEDAVEVVDAARAVLLVGVDDHLGVGVGAEAVAQRLQPLADAEVVVDLAVDHHGAALVLGPERLVAAGRVDDREARVHQHGLAEPLDALAVGAAMPERRGHRVAGTGWEGAVRVHQRGDPTHGAELTTAPRGPPAGSR